MTNREAGLKLSHVRIQTVENTPEEIAAALTYIRARVTFPADIIAMLGLEDAS